jgi:hypothetical protein
MNASRWPRYVARAFAACERLRTLPPTDACRVAAANWLWYVLHHESYIEVRPDPCPF